MYAFREIDLSDMVLLKKLRNCDCNDLTATAFESLYSWQKYFGFSVYTEEDFAVIYSGHLDGYMFPFGDASKCDEFIRTAVNENKKFVFLSKKQAEILEDMGCSVSEDRNSDEYIYESCALALKSGNISSNLNRKCKTFMKNHSVEVFTMDESNLSSAAELIHTYETEKGDRDAAEAFIYGFSTLGLMGITLKTEIGNAFIMGYENTDDIFTMSVVIYDSKLGSDIVPVCINKLAETVCGKYKYIDMEEDLGIEGLRTMKQLYKPEYMLQSYTAEKI